MKKNIVFLGCILAVGGSMAGCQKREAADMRSEEVTKLIWQCDQDFERYEEYLNEVLKEKKLPYEVMFIAEDAVKDGQAADLKSVPWTWEKTYDVTEEILEGKFLALDEYLNTEEGKVIKDTLPEKVWDAYKVNGKQYTVLSVGFVPTKTVYIWDRELAEKYDVHPEEWNEKIWEYEEELKKVYDGEKAKGPFLTIEGLRLYSDNLKGLTEPLGFFYPFVIRETDEDPKAELLYENQEYQEYFAGVRKLYEAGIYNPDLEENYEADKRVFLKIETDFKTKDAYCAWESQDFWNMHEVKEVWQRPLWRLSCCAQEVGIMAESEHPEEAFDFLCSLYGDADLTNALMWGEEGKNYELIGNTAVKPMAGGYIPALYAGNNFIGYAEVGQDEKKAELYPKWLEKCQVSKISGFMFSGKECEQELARLYQVMNEKDQKNGKSILEEGEMLLQRCKEAGADKVIEEWNRQYQRWRQKKEGYRYGIKD